MSGSGSGPLARTMVPTGSSFASAASATTVESAGCAGPASLLCTADQTTTVTWAYVGDGKGKFSEEKVYNFVGDGQGAYEKEEIKSYHNWRPRLCTIVAALIVAALGLIYLAVRNWHWPGGGGGVAEPHNCLTGFDVGWNDEKKHWCCINHGMGCPPDGSVKPIAGVGQIASHLQGCDTDCDLDGHKATCGFRVQYASTHRFAGTADACSQAYNMGSSSATSAASALWPTQVADARHGNRGPTRKASGARGRRRRAARDKGGTAQWG
eukprot:CAMPEP_0195079090 /NCGR_PEP_ID=MMETSP0448-20130528/21114_1 /TAXON_ID=66468 /ORGANISM="Heterocapsa triquestra, Strain CCMP 448" /LENGTH=266 /DNA_ID=CAMNT_0040111893 /DNA_START=29 /DNA_END=826 /DNA_ORIENTATION=+